MPACTEDLLLALRRPIAIVGNGHPGRDLGVAIDRYATVIRLNNFRLAGHRSLVGSRTSIRATSGWHDIEVRDAHVEISPFTPQSAESANLEQYRRATSVPVLAARTDVHELVPAIHKPSTGFALAALASSLGVPVDLFGFDGFRSGHYWSDAPHATTHSGEELAALLALPGVTVYGRSFDYEALYDFCHAEHAGYDENEGLALVRHLGLSFAGERVLEFGAGNGELAAAMQHDGSQVTAVEVSPVAFARIPVAEKVLGDALTLTTLGGGYDRFVSFDVLEHLTENDVRIVIREAARLARAITVSVCTRPSGLLGPAGENLHLTVRPVAWWTSLIGEFFDAAPCVGIGPGQVVFSGERRSRPVVAPRREPAAPAPADLALPPHYVARPVPQYFVDSPEMEQGVVWQPDVYRVAAELARKFGCRSIVDVGCGQARKLTALHPEFSIVGIDYGANIEFCRRTYPVGMWLETDLEQHEVIPLPVHQLRESVVVCSDVIEHLVDPRPLLATLADLLEHAPLCVLSTPDRVRTHGAGHAGPPPNASHTREWTAEELATLCRAAGLDVIGLDHTRSNDRTNELATILAVVHGERLRAERLAGAA